MKRRSFVSRLGVAVIAPAAVLSSRSLAAAAGPLVIGQSVALSGPVGAQMQVANAGSNLAFAQANKSGGIRGRNIELVSLDDELKDTRTLENCTKLVNEHAAVALFGLVGTPSMLAVAPLLRETGIPLLGNYSASDAARQQAGLSAFFVRAGFEREAARIAEQLAILGLARIALASVKGPGGASVKAALDQHLLARGAPPIASSVTITNDGSDLQEAIDTVAKSAPQAVVLFIGGTLPARFIDGLEAKEIHPHYYGLSSVPAEYTAKTVGKRLRSLVVSQVVPYPWAPANVEIAHYRKLATDAGVPVGYTSFEGYITASVLVAALKRGGRDITRASLQASLRSLKTRIAGMDIDFTTGNHTGSSLVDLVLINEKGQFYK
ncbi:MAG: putative transporter, substrate-binding protein [Ramlibacter sp.]|nr:putative transporter, substrate-binding protein [Ramlibacter sp.]